MGTEARWHALVEEFAARHPDVGPGQMFGRPCLKRGKKMAACLWHDGGVSVKLVDEAQRAAALALDGAELFDPGMGRQMREWVHLPAEQVAAWEGFLEQALETLPLD